MKDNGRERAGQLGGCLLPETVLCFPFVIPGFVIVRDEIPIKNGRKRPFCLRFLFISKCSDDLMRKHGIAIASPSWFITQTKQVCESRDFVAMFLKFTSLVESKNKISLVAN